MALRLSYAALVIALVLPATARAAPPSIDWRAPSDCPRAEVVRAAVAQVLSSKTEAQVSSVRAQVTREGEAYRLDLTIRTPQATSKRRLLAERCATFVDLLALELGVIATLPAAAATGIDASAGMVEQSTRSRYAWGARASGAVGTGPLPSPAPRVAVHGTFAQRRLQLELGATYDLRRTLRYREPATVRAHFDLIAGQLRLCYALPVGSLALPLCTGIEAGALRGHGRGVQAARRVQRPWLALTATAGARWPRSATVAAVVQLEGSFGVLRPAYGVRNLPLLYRPDRFDVRALLGAELQFD